MSVACQVSICSSDSSTACKLGIICSALLQAAAAFVNRIRLLRLSLLRASLRCSGASPREGLKHISSDQRWHFEREREMRLLCFKRKEELLVRLNERVS